MVRGIILLKTILRIGGQVVDVKDGGFQIHEEIENDGEIEGVE